MTAQVYASRAASPGYWGRPRCLHVIDLESLARTGGPPPEQLLRLAWASYRQAIGIQRGDHAVLGLRSARFGELSDLLAGCGAQLRAAAEPGGVRAALLDSVDVAHAARRFRWLVIASGHGQFAGLASAAQAAGMRVWLVGGTAPCGPTLAAVSAQRSRLHLPRAAA